MSPTHEHNHQLLALAEQWRALVLFAVAFARQILRMETTDARGALKKVELLELWLCAAFAALERQCGADATLAQVRLQAITTALVLLTLFAARVKRRLMAQEAPASLKCAALSAALPTLLAAGPTCPPAYIDTG